MKSLRSLFGVVLALALAAFAVPALAQKSYTLTASPLTGTSPQTITLTFTATGNSSFNSTTVAVPLGYTVPIANVSASRGTVSAIAGGFAVSGITTPVGSPSQVVTVTMSNVTTSGTCGAGVSGEWRAQPWTGSNPGDGQRFNISGGFPTTSITPFCYTATASAGANGTITPASRQVAPNATTTFTVTPNTGFFVSAMGGTCGGTLSGTTFTTSPITANCTVTASFAAKPTLTYTAGPGGTIVGTSPQTVEYGGSGTSVTAVPNTNYRFVNWSDGKTDNPRTDSNVTVSIGVTANFALNSLTFTTPPPSTIGAGTSFPVTIGINGPGGTVNVSVSGTGCTLTEPIPSSFDVAGLSATFNVTIAQLSPPADQTSCVLNVSATGYQSASYAFANVYGGTLGCADGFNYDSSKGKTNFVFDPDADIAYVNAPGWGLLRGANNDGVTCKDVNATLTLNGKFASLIYDKTGPEPDQPNAAFKYVLLWTPIPVISSGELSGWSQQRPKVAWGNFGVAGPVWPTDYVPALFCLDDGSGFENLTPTQLLALLPTIPNVAPFNTPAFANYPQYQPGQPAKMCVAQQGVTAVLGSVQYWTKIIDQADGWVSTED